MSWTSVSRNVASLNIHVHDLINLLHYFPNSICIEHIWLGASAMAPECRRKALLKESATRTYVVEKTFPGLYSYFRPPENTRKPKNFWCFHRRNKWEHWSEIGYLHICKIYSWTVTVKISSELGILVLRVILWR